MTAAIETERFQTVDWRLNTKRLVIGARFIIRFSVFINCKYNWQGDVHVVFAFNNAAYDAQYIVLIVHNYSNLYGFSQNLCWPLQLTTNNSLIKYLLSKWSEIVRSVDISIEPQYISILVFPYMIFFPVSFARKNNEFDPKIWQK